MLGTPKQSPVALLPRTLPTLALLLMQQKQAIHALPWLPQDQSCSTALAAGLQTVQGTGGEEGVGNFGGPLKVASRAGASITHSSLHCREKAGCKYNSLLCYKKRPGCCVKGQSQQAPLLESGTGKKGLVLFGSSLTVFYLRGLTEQSLPESNRLGNPLTESTTDGAHIEIFHQLERATSQMMTVDLISTRLQNETQTHPTVRSTPLS